MADMCGGSTPLKALADRGSSDRSLQQDRHMRAGPSNSFRANGSTPDTSADRMYAGFANGPGPLPVQPLSTGLDSFGPRHAMARPMANASPVPQAFAANPTIDGRSFPPPGVSTPQSWAMDFANFNSAPQASATAPMAAPAPSHHGYHVPMMPHAHIGPSAFLGAGFAGPTMLQAGPGTTNSYAATTNTSTQYPQDSATAEVEFDNAMAQWMAINGHGEDVDGILEEMAQELEEGQRAGLPELQPTRVSALETNTSAAAVDFAGAETATQAARMEPGSLNTPGVLPELTNLRLDDREQQATADNNVTDQSQGSEVSEAARQLLETVQHEQGEKWQKSRFLSLMREFRDGTKSIVNEEIRESGDRTTSTGISST